MMTDRDPSSRYAGEMPTSLPENRRDADITDAFVEFLAVWTSTTFSCCRIELSRAGMTRWSISAQPQAKLICVSRTSRDSMAHGYAKATGKLGVCMVHISSA